MTLSTLTLPTSIDMFFAPKKAEHGHSFSAKIILDEPFFPNFSYKQLRKMISELRHNVSAYRIMAYFCKQGFDVKSYCRIERNDDCDATFKWNKELFRNWEPSSYKLSELEKMFSRSAHNPRGLADFAYSPCLNIDKFYVPALLICQAMVNYELIKPSGPHRYLITPEMYTLLNQTARIRIPRAKAWSLMPQLIQKAQAYNATNPPIMINGLFLFGSLSRDAETVDDIDISIQTGWNASMEQNHEAYLAACIDYTTRYNVTESRRYCYDGPDRDVRQHLYKQFSRLDRFKTSNITHSELSDGSARFYCLLDASEKAGPLNLHHGFVNIERSVEEGRLVLCSSPASS